MIDEAAIRETLRRYPEEISKEQLCRLCHISKRVAKYYLDNGVIPCRNNGQATHTYAIKTRDAITFLRRRDACPEAFRVSIRSGCKPFVHSSIRYTRRVMQVYRRLFSPSGWQSILPSLTAFLIANWGIVLLLILCAVICFALPNSNRIGEKTQFRARDAAVSAVLLMLSIFNMSQVSTFLYFNF